MTSPVAPLGVKLDHDDDGDLRVGEGPGNSTDTGLGISVISGDARSLGQTGAVLSRKDRLQVQCVNFAEQYSSRTPMFGVASSRQPVVVNGGVLQMRVELRL